MANRAFRAVWGAAWLLFAAWTPAPFHRWRAFVLRCFGATIDRTARVYGSCRIWYPPNLRLESHACLGPQVICYCMAPITVGARAIVSQGAHLCAGSHDIDDGSFQLVSKPIAIGADAWVAAQAFIGPGVSIGERAVIGARGVLFKDAEPGGVYVGNPAKLVRQRKLACYDRLRD